MGKKSDGAKQRRLCAIYQANTGHGAGSDGTAHSVAAVFAADADRRRCNARQSVFCTAASRKDLDKDGRLLPDAVRLNAYGRFLRKTSLDELPQLLNVINGTHVFVGPRPMLVRDMVFMSPQVRRRHTVWPGITGWAQVHGRNSISWEEKFVYDLAYIDRGITFKGDLQILFMTVAQVFRHSDVNRKGTASDLDYGDWLLAEGRVTQEEYDKKQREALELLRGVS